MSLCWLIVRREPIWLVSDKWLPSSFIWIGLLCSANWLSWGFLVYRLKKSILSESWFPMNRKSSDPRPLMLPPLELFWRITHFLFRIYDCCCCYRLYEDGRGCFSIREILSCSWSSSDCLGRAVEGVWVMNYWAREGGWFIW